MSIMRELGASELAGTHATLETKAKPETERTPETQGTPGTGRAPARQGTPGAAGGSAGAPARDGILVAYASLLDSNALVADWLKDLDVACTFSDDVYSAAERHDPRLAVLHFTQAQAQRLAALMERHPGTSVLGVVMDMTGHHTHRAIQHGASWVLNMLLPPESCLNLLRMVIQVVVPVPIVPAGAELAAQAVPRTAGPAAGAEKVPRKGPRKAADAQEEELLALLCGPAPIAEIAKCFYCSERSMYRQLRALYARYGVTGRQQLRREIALRSEPNRRQEMMRA
jgi:DNA-binding NarL/FixJ family response regulator